MAPALKNNAVLQVHQCLHGYVDGHRLIACSTTLKPRDLKTMLILSDSSGPGAMMDDAGYLTGYPLPESGFYALARTWAATEISRPGCVWTHTILVDFADLALVSSMDHFMLEFRRPGNPILPSNYGKVLRLPEPPSCPTLSTVTLDNKWRESLRRILWGLYSITKPVQAAGGHKIGHSLMGRTPPLQAWSKSSVLVGNAMRELGRCRGWITLGRNGSFTFVWRCDFSLLQLS